MKIIKKTDEIYFIAELVTPRFAWNKSTQTLHKTVEKAIVLDIPIKFVLTHQENYFRLQISFIIGLKISLKILENKNEY